MTNTYTNTFTLSTGATGFRVASGKIIDPTGQIWQGRGINLGNQGDGSDYALQDGAAHPLTTVFPGINVVRLTSGPNGYGGTYPSNMANTYEPHVKRMTDNKIVVIIEDHSVIGGQQGPYSGQNLTNQSNWYAAMATFYKDNPYVWFGGLNEVGDQAGAAAITAMLVSNYNAIRNTGSNTLFVMPCGAGAGVPNEMGSSYYNASSYANMTNIVWDYHWYPWVTPSQGSSVYPTDQTTVNSIAVNGASGRGPSGILVAGSIRSKDGVVPVFLGEYGPSTDGASRDPNGLQVAYAGQWAVQQGYAAGNTAWQWQPRGQDDVLVPNGLNILPFNQYSKSAWGNEVASFIATGTPN